MTSDGTRGAARDPIFILAPQARTGTNYLWELLRRHPDCAPARPPVWEDYTLIHARHLVEYARQTQRAWDPSWGPTRHLRGELLRHLGDGVLEFLTTDPDRRLVTKSPTIANLHVFFDLFPSAYLLLLVRDGRDVAASGMKTFGWTLEDAARTWAWGADRIVDFTAAHDGGRVRLVGFEGLVEDLRPALTDVLTWLDLDPHAYDFGAAGGVPVRGSSSFGTAAGGEVHWEGVRRSETFRPVGRWADWSAADVATFERIAGAQLERLGYPRRGGRDPDPAPRHRLTLLE